MLVYQLFRLAWTAWNHPVRIAYPVSQVFAGRSKRTKRFPHFTTYLAEVVERRIARVQRTVAMIGCGLMLVTTPIVATIAWLASGNVGIAVLSAVVAWPASAVAWYVIDKRLRRPKSPDEAKRLESWKASQSLLQLEQQRRFHKRMDPSMSQLLEAAAYHYSRIQGAAEGSFWSSESLPAQWRAVRSQSLEAAEQAMEESPTQVEEHVGRAKNLARESLQEARRSVWDLLPRALEERSIEAALHQLVDRWTADGPENASFSISGEKREVSSDIQVTLLRVCQESLTNIRSHARATNVQVDLAFYPECTSLGVQDDGKGFNFEKVRAKGRQSGFGLSSMEQRTHLVGGTFTVKSDEGAGALVEVRIPTS